VEGRVVAKFEVYLTYLIASAEQAGTGVSHKLLTLNFGYVTG
jgi:hypothetical protein